jgi:hypothetical protein
VLDSQLQIRSAVLVVRSLHVELRTIRYLTVAKNIDCDEDKVDMSGKGSATLHQQVTQPVDRDDLRLAVCHKSTLAVWEQRGECQGKEWTDAVQVSQWNDPVALHLTSTSRVQEIGPGSSCEPFQRETVFHLKAYRLWSYIDGSPIHCDLRRER